MSNPRARIKFDLEEVCTACRFAEHKKNIDCSQREKKLLKLCIIL